MEFSTIKITLEKVSGNNVGFWTSKIIPRKVHGNNVDFSTIKITSKKVRGNDMYFSISEIYIEKEQENDVEIRRNLVFTVSMKYRRRINIDSPWCIRWVLPSALW